MDVAAAGLAAENLAQATRLSRHEKLLQRDFDRTDNLKRSNFDIRIYGLDR
jgi:hypothetical protein